MTSFHMAWRRYFREVSSPSSVTWTALERVGVIRRESSEQRCGSATVTNTVHRPTSPHPGFRPVRVILVAAVALLVAGCATWTGSVGAVLAKSNADGRVFVRDVPPGMGAARAGIAVGDEVVAIEGKPVVKMTPEEVHEALAGKVGTKVKVTVLRAGVTVECNVERGPLSGT
jgi:predicted metalloprotease with PDZ domain